MGALSNRTATARIEDVVLRAVNLALRERLIAADVAALRALPSKGVGPTQSVDPGRLVYVTSLDLSCEWDTFSTIADNGTTVIKPTDVSVTSPGRWLARANPGGATPLRLRGTDVTEITSGYLKQVALYEGERTDDEMEGRIFGQRPCVLLEFVDRPKTRKSTNAGALSLCDFRFQLWIVDFNARGNLTAQRGSAVASELARSPGAYAIAGDLEDLLDGAIGGQLGETAIGFCRTSSLSLVDKQIADRGRIIMQLEFGVWASTAKGDPDATDLDSIYLQPQIAVARPGDEDVDPENVIISGLYVTIGSGLSRAPANGSAKIDDVTVTVTSAAAHTFAVSSDTYRDLKTNGMFTYTAVSIGSDEPAQAASTLRVGYTRTDSSGAVEDVLLAPQLRDDGTPHPIVS